MPENKKRLVLCSIGDVRVPLWLAKEKNFDVCLIFYGKNSRIAEKLKSRSEYFLCEEGFKMPNYLKAINQFQLLKTYSSLVFIDDDIVVYPDIVGECFNRLERYGLEACQPSRVGRSLVWEFLRQKKNVLLEYTNFIECGFMCLTRNMVEKLLPYWNIFYTGYGVDNILHCLVEGEDKIAVFHDICFFHPTRTALRPTLIRTNNSQLPFNSGKVDTELQRNFGFTGMTFRPRVYRTLMLEKGAKHSFAMEVFLLQLGPILELMNPFKLVVIYWCLLKGLIHKHKVNFIKKRGAS